MKEIIKKKKNPTSMFENKEKSKKDTKINLKALISKGSNKEAP